MNAEDIVLPNPGEFGDVPPTCEEPVRTREDDILLNEGIDFNGAGSFFSEELPPFDWIVDGMLAAGTEGQRGFKGDLIAGSKGRKSFFAMQLGLCVAAGMDICGYRVRKPRKVAYLNLELVPRGFQERIWKMCRSLGLERDAISRRPVPGDDGMGRQPFEDGNRRICKQRRGHRRHEGADRSQGRDDRPRPACKNPGRKTGVHRRVPC